MDPTKSLEGTRLTLLERAAEGFEFSICTPSTPTRWELYSAEMDHIFLQITDLLSAPVVGDKKVIPHNSITTNTNSITNPIPTSTSTPPMENDILLTLALKLFYLWVNFAPLTRGTAVCGYAALFGLVLGQKKIFTDKLPKDIQLDWEAILASNVEHFVMKAKKWMVLGPFEVNEKVGNVSDIFPTIRSMVKSLLIIPPASLD